MVPYSGGSSHFGQSLIKGYEHAFEDFMKHYGDTLNGNTVELVYGDTAGVPDTAVTELERMISVEKVSAVIGTYNSGPAAAMAPLCIKNKIPFQVTTCVSDLILAEPNSYVFRANTGDTDTRAYWDMFLDHLVELTGEPLESLAIIYDNSDFGHSASTMLKGLCTEKGMKIAFDEAITTDSADLSSVINKIKDVNADFLISILYVNDSLLFVRQAKEFDLETPIFGYGAGMLTEEFLQQSGELSNYIVLCSQYFYDESLLSEEAIEYQQRYMKEINSKNVNENYPNGWMGMYSLLEAIARAGSGDRDAIAAELAKTDIKKGERALMMMPSFEGIKYEDFKGRYNQNIYSAFQFSQIMDGTYKIIFPVPASGKSPIVFPPPKWSER